MLQRILVRLGFLSDQNFSVAIQRPITQTNPADSALVAPGLETVRIDFSEYIKSEAINSDNFQVKDADDNLLEPVNISQTNDGKTIELTFAPIETGEYRLEISAANIADVSGNVLGTENIVQTFSVKPAKVTSLHNTITDIDPDKEGIQAYQESGTYYFRANVSEPVGTKIEQVDFLINDEVVATDTTNIFAANLRLPKITPDANTATIVARGTDGNGDFSYTDAVEVELVDITAPTIVRTNPLDSAVISSVLGLETISVDFSEYIATETVTSSNFQVFDAEDNLLEPISIEQTNDGKRVELTFATLGIGNYRLEINALDITDLSSNALGTENIVRNFSIEPAKVTTLFSNVGDVDPDKEGIQAYDESRVYLRADVQEPTGTSIEQVEFLVNDEVVATDTAGSVFSANIDLPKISPEVDAVSIVARGTDNNGDVTLTEALEIELVDVTAPTIARSIPANSALVAPGIETVRIDFSEYISASSVNLDNLQVFDAENNLQSALSIEQINEGKSIELTFAPLQVGQYRLEIDAANIIDLSGNALGTQNTVNTFSVESAKVTNLVTSIVDADPDVEGTQGYEYSKVLLRANISEPEGTSIEQVEFLVNGEVVATDTTGKTFSRYINLPEITDEADTATIVARGTDAEGNITLTDEIEINLVNVFNNPLLYIAETVTDNLDFQIDTSEFDFLNLVSISGNKPFKQPDYINVGQPQPETLLADVNGDEIEDRIVLNDNGTFSVEIGALDGIFQEPIDYSFARGNGELIDSALITAGDIDDDGDDDVLIAYQELISDETDPGVDETVSSYLSVFRGSDNGIDPRPNNYSSLFDEPYGYPESFVLKDIDNDGLDDWIAFDRDNLEVRVIRYNPELGRLFWFNQSLNTDPEYLAVGNFIERYISQDVIGADSTKTQLELVSYFTRSNDFDIFRVYDEDSRASIRRSSHTLDNPSDYVAVEDLDGDNRYDWITVTEDRSQVDIYLKNSDGSNKLENTITFDTETAPSSVNMGDINEDGNFDLLAVYEETGDFFAYFGNGDGTFAEPIAFNLPGEYDSPILRDLDGDGDEDLIAVTDDSASGNKTFSVFKSDGEGNYAEPFSYTFSDSSRDFVLKDLDGDGDEDLVGINPFDNRITVVNNQDNDSFGDESRYDLDDFDYLSFQDLDEDGDLDLLTSTENQRSFSLLFNAGNGMFGSPDSLQFGNSVQYLGFKDLDGDDVLDLTGTFDRDQRELFIALGREDGSFGVTTTYLFDQAATELSLIDIDENGIKDLLSLDRNRSKASLFLTYPPSNGGNFNTTKKRTSVLPDGFEEPIIVL